MTSATMAGILAKLRGVLGKSRARPSINPKYARRRLRRLVAAERSLLRRFVPDGALVLDAGCGDGRNAFRIVDELAITPRRVVMLDINPDMLELGRRNIAADEGTAHLFEVAEGSVFQVPFPDGTFDVSICVGNVLSLAAGGTIAEGLDELRRVTDEGGVILFSLATREYLQRVAHERGLPDRAAEVEATGVYTHWNDQYGEGVCKSWGPTSLVPDNVRAASLMLLEVREVYTDYRDVPACLLLACRRV